MTRLTTHSQRKEKNKCGTTDTRNNLDSPLALSYGGRQSKIPICCIWEREEERGWIWAVAFMSGALFQDSWGFSTNCSLLIGTAVKKDIHHPPFWNPKINPFVNLKHKRNEEGQTSSLGRPRSNANRSCTLLLYHESFAYSIGPPIHDWYQQEHPGAALELNYLLLTICSLVWGWRRGISLKVQHWFVIFCGRADSWTWSS
ncbi:hypothetical protein AVEN_96420-1 [Araneus ventricosus]|uniref:Uncharacterized protein n=1 Tax=Araneus ventricosus TaxID=182803 RepID=A0A4Y2HWU7_ARAVE|nr:hypothetical protein AVEN_96420-1 [Araneus ventricosus]